MFYCLKHIFSTSTLADDNLKYWPNFSLSSPYYAGNCFLQTLVHSFFEIHYGFIKIYDLFCALSINLWQFRKFLHLVYICGNTENFNIQLCLSQRRWDYHRKEYVWGDACRKIRSSTICIHFRSYAMCFHIRYAEIWHGWHDTIKYLTR